MCLVWHFWFRHLLSRRKRTVQHEKSGHESSIVVVLDSTLFTVSKNLGSPVTQFETFSDAVQNLCLKLLKCVHRFPSTATHPSEFGFNKIASIQAGKGFLCSNKLLDALLQCAMSNPSDALRSLSILVAGSDGLILISVFPIGLFMHYCFRRQGTRSPHSPCPTPKSPSAGSARPAASPASRPGRASQGPGQPPRLRGAV